MACAAESLKLQTQQKKRFGFQNGDSQKMNGGPAAKFSREVSSGLTLRTL